ncbi:RTA1 like protein-domain-containing protein [Aspergillus tamarii]|uniref:RTA1 like protein-domain-containing protein n=1 Tax=Aspergillus tamarii TaxID=41984 RepID=A0A5N6V8E9_ASPTM|nr:RTA1 like protein-domain-containing protein [Aspergillus tamarii]
MSSDSSNMYGDYVPSNVAAIVVAVIFFILTVLHIWKIITTRHWFAFATVTGGIFEVIGLAARAVSHNDLSSKAPYIVQVLLILLAPIIFSASIYMFLGRLIRASGYPQLSFIRINWLTKIFVCGDILCFFVQASGAGKLVNAETSTEISSARNTVLGGLGLQVFCFCIFMLCAVVFHVRVSRRHIASNVDPSLRLSTMLFSLYFCSLCIVVRNIYRLIEYQAGESGYLQTHEWPSYVLDVALMALMMMISLIWYFSNTKPKDPASYRLDGCDGQA